MAQLLQQHGQAVGGVDVVVHHQHPERPGVGGLLG